MIGQKTTQENHFSLLLKNNAMPYLIKKNGSYKIVSHEPPAYVDKGSRQELEERWMSTPSKLELRKRQIKFLKDSLTDQGYGYLRKHGTLEDIDLV